MPPALHWVPSLEWRGVPESFTKSYLQGKESKYNLKFMHLGASIEVTERTECSHAIQHL